MKKQKHNVLIQNKQKMNNQIINKGIEINMLLDLFGGKLTLTDILDNDIPLIKLLRDTRISMNVNNKNNQQENRTTKL